jgi:DNA modification methylase
VQDKTIDLVITSPPYLNAIDYLRCSKFSLVWIGHDVEDLRATRSEMIGAEVSAADPDVANDVIKAHGRLGPLPPRWRNVLARYIHDIDQVLAESARVLVSGGRAVFVVGDSNVRGVYVRNSKLVSLLGPRHGLSVESVARRRLPDRLRYLPPPKKSINSKRGLGARMRSEAVVALRA